MPSAPSASVASVAKKPVEPTSTASLEYQQALDSFALGDYSTAEEHARKAGSGKSARLLLAQVLEREGRSGEAKAVFRQIIESDPANAAALAGLKRLGG